MSFSAKTDHPWWLQSVSRSQYDGKVNCTEETDCLNRARRARGHHHKVHDLSILRARFLQKRYSQSYMHLDVRRMAASFGFAGSGLLNLWRTQTNARVHGLATVLVVAMGVWLQLAPRDLALLVFAIVLVWAAEAMNTAVEATVDLVTKERRPLARIAKDTAAAAVLVCALGAAAVGALILGPALYGWWQSP